MTNAPHVLTPANVQDLRDSIRWRVSNGRDDTWTDPGVAYIIWGPADGHYILRAYGRPMAASHDIAVLAACLRAERAEPGFIARILDPATDCRTASLSPDLAAAERRRLAALAAEVRSRASLDAELKRTRAVNRRVDVSKIELDDLLN